MLFDYFDGSEAFVRKYPGITNPCFGCADEDFSRNTLATEVLIYINYFLIVMKLTNQDQKFLKKALPIGLLKVIKVPL